MTWAKTILVAVVSLAAVAPARADMIPMPRPCAASGLRTAVYDHPDLRPMLDDSGSLCVAVARDWSSFPVRSLPKVLADEGQTGDPQTLYVLSDRQNSLSLCLYALLSLGLCQSAPWAKRLSLAVIPGRHRDVGLFQVDYNTIVSRDCLSPVVTGCLARPYVGDRVPTQAYRRGVIASLRPKSQFAPTASAPRGPPLTDLEVLLA